MWLFKWIQDKKIKNINPFWARVALVKDENNTETLKRFGKTVTERVQYNSKDVNNEDDKYSNDKNSDGEDQESSYFYILRDKADLYKHIANCHYMYIVFKLKIRIKDDQIFFQIIQSMFVVREALK